MEEDTLKKSNKALKKLRLLDKPWALYILNVLEGPITFDYLLYLYSLEVKTISQPGLLAKLEMLVEAGYVEKRKDRNVFMYKGIPEELERVVYLAEELASL